MKLWDDFLRSLEEELGRATVEKWLRPLKIIRFDAGNLHLDASDAFQILWYKEHITKPLKSSSGLLIKLHFYLRGELYVEQKRSKVAPPLIQQHFSQDHLTSSSTFTTFLVEQEPFLPYDLLSKADGTYNPIFLYGQEGSGKTHLLMATAHRLKQEGKNAFYVRSETFMEHVIRAFRTGSLQEFRFAYRDLDALIIDDVHRLKGKGVTQEELFHTFNHLHIQKKQIVLSATAAPQLLSGIEERLKSRFEWGITLPLTPASVEGRKKIIHKRAADLSLSLDEEIVSYLVETFQTLPSLMRALEALTLRLHQCHLTFDLHLTRHLLSDLIEEERRELLTPEKIVKCVADIFRITCEDILGKSQRKECVFCRKIAMYFCRSELSMPYLKIGAFFSRDHSTVISSIRQIEQGKANLDRSITSPLLEIKQRIGSSAF